MGIDTVEYQRRNSGTSQGPTSGRSSFSDGSVSIKGLAELQEALRQLPLNIERNILRGALRQGVKVIGQEAKRLAPVLSGELRGSIRWDVKTDNGKLFAYVKAGQKTGADGASDGKAWYARFVEYGTVAHLITANPPNRALAVGVVQVHHPGAKGRAFMRQAFDFKRGEAITRVADYIRERLATKHGLYVPAPADPEGGDGPE